MQKRVKKKFSISYKKKTEESLSFKKEKEEKKSAGFKFVAKRKEK